MSTTAVDTDKKLTDLMGRMHALYYGRSNPDFLATLRLDFKYVKAYFDQVDGLPVMVTKIVTNNHDKNVFGLLSTGVLSTIFDHLSTSTMFCDPNLWVLPDGTVNSMELAPHVDEAKLGLEIGLSRSIKVHIEHNVPAGTTLYLTTKILENTPKSMYFCSSLFAEDGTLVATGRHDKVKLTKTVTAKL